MLFRRRAAFLLVATLAVACTEPAIGPDAGRAALDDHAAEQAHDETDDVVPPADDSPGADLYAQHCARCHGDEAEGGEAASLRGWSEGRALLVTIIDESMPFGRAGDCTGDCAESIADWLLALQTPGSDGGPAEDAPVDCAEPGWPQRTLRLLTPAELAASVERLADSLTPACSLDADCGASVSCVQGVCEERPCDQQRFAFDAQGQSYASVALAGSFNGWSADAPGWAMQLDPVSALWTLTRSLPDGHHSYKIVLDGQSWIEDPAAASSEPDGFGGQNSVRVVACAGVEAPPSLDEDWAAGLPPPQRPTGFAFDAHGGALVTEPLLDAWSAKATRFAEAAVARRAALLGCDASAAGCLEGFVRDLGRRVYRRPLEEEEVTRYLGLLSTPADLDDGLRALLRVLLTSPSFLYRAEVGELTNDGSYALSGWEVASALSFLLLGGPPDEALLAAAADGTLNTAAGREAEARRLLATPRAREVLGDFALSWLGADRVRTVDKSDVFASAFGDDVRDSMAQETRRFFSHVMFDSSGRLDELFTAQVSVVDDVLAAFYGLTPSAQPGFTVVPSTDGRTGVLGQGAVLASYAYPDQTAPVRRGLFVRERLLCQDLGAPPPNAGAIPEIEDDATTRERFAQHTADSFCYACHQYIDPVGFGFERYDPIGRWRDSDNGLPVDAAGDMNDVESLGSDTSAPFDSLSGLGATLAESDSLHACFVRQMWRYTSGRLERPADACALEPLEEQFLDSGGDVRELLVDLVRDEAFVRRAP
jgi:mono/diheme cytochrome c family protein